MGEEDATGPPSRIGTPRVPSPKSLKDSSRSSHDGSTVPLHRPSSKPTVGASAGTPPPGQAARPRATSPSSSRSGTTVHHHTSSRNRKASRATIDATEKRPEELYELLCNGVLLPNEMTLAAVKQYRWKGAGELVMEYRRLEYPSLKADPA
jgi:WD repeat-containing protein 48